MTTTLNHYNKKNTKRRTNTQKKHKNKNSHGGRNEFGPGKVYYFGEGNTDELDRLMQKSKVPIIFRHADDDCPHCKRFEKPWSVIEKTTRYPSQSHSVASLDPFATDYIVNNYPDYPRVNGVPAVILVNKEGVPIEHTGPNTLEAIQAFLDRNGLKIVPKDQERDQLQDEDEFGAGLGAGIGDAGIGAAGIGAAGIGAAGIGAADIGAAGIGAADIGAPESELGAPESELGAPESELGAGLGAPESELGAGLGAPESKSILTGVTETVTKIDDKIKNSITALTEPINFKNLFGVKSDTTEQAANAFPPAPEPEQEQEQDQAQPQPQAQTQPQDQVVNVKAPQLPSTGGRSKKGKHSRRHHKNKSSSRKKYSKRKPRKHAR